MFCAPVTLLHYFEEFKTGGLFCPSVKSLGGAKQPPGFMFSIVITIVAQKTCLYSFRLHCLYISQGGWCLSSQSLKKGPENALNNLFLSSQMNY